jgi:hypothetical protein
MERGHKGSLHTTGEHALVYEWEMNEFLYREFSKFHKIHEHSHRMSVNSKTYMSKSGNKINWSLTPWK